MAFLPRIANRFCVATNRLLCNRRRNAAGTWRITSVTCWPQQRFQFIAFIKAHFAAVLARTWTLAKAAGSRRSGHECTKSRRLAQELSKTSGCSCQYCALRFLSSGGRLKEGARAQARVCGFPWVPAILEGSCFPVEASAMAVSIMFLKVPFSFWGRFQAEPALILYRVCFE